MKIILIFLVASLFLSFVLNHFFQIKTSLYFERFFISIKKLISSIDFLNTNNPLYLSHVSILNEFYPYEINIYDLLKQIYGGGSAVSNSYIMDGFIFWLIWIFYNDFVKYNISVN